MKTGLMIICGVVAILGVGCAALSSYVTPATVDAQAVQYAAAANVIEPGAFDGYSNLEKAERLGRVVDAAHEMNQFEINQMAAKDNLLYSNIKDVVAANLVKGQQLESSLFSDTGLLSVGLTAAGFGGLTGLVGLMRKRPGDVTADELNAALAKATGESKETIAAKTAQFTQVVASFQKVIESVPDEVKAKIKSICNETQDTATQVAVAEVKKSVLS